MIQKLLSYEEATELLGVSRSTLTRLVGRRQIPVVRIGSRCLFRQEAIEAWISEHTQEGAHE